MSLFSTIAHDGSVPARGAPKRMWMMAAGLALAATVGFVIVNNSAAEPLETAPVVNAGPAHDEFVRINTTDMAHLSPTATASGVESAPSVDPFIYWNTTALDNLVPAQGNPIQSKVSDEFLRWNVDSLEYAGAKYSEPSSGPR